MLSSDWPSLAPHVVLAERLFGPRGDTLLKNWMDQQLERITDPDFARLFSDHIDLPGVSPGDFNHRLVKAGSGQLLGGIRFYGQDRTRPFVDVIAHDFDNWRALCDVVRSEWRVFAPLHLRVLVSAGASIPLDAHVDMSVYLAAYRDMLPPDGPVTLSPFTDVEEAVAMVSERYRNLAKTDAKLALNVSASGPDDLRAWHTAGQLMAIRADIDGAITTVGLLAVAPGTVAWIEGDEVNEEVVATAYGGHGFAASAQRAWASRNKVEADRLLIGTIDRLNVASRLTARRVGRKAVLDYVFTPLQECRASEGS